jgi:hypothetical protein
MSFFRTRYAVLKIITMNVITAAKTSSGRYWYKVRSKAAERKCGAPPCLMTYSVQKMAVSGGVWGLPLN